MLNMVFGRSTRRALHCRHRRHCCRLLKKKAGSPNSARRARSDSLLLDSGSIWWESPMMPSADCVVRKSNLLNTYDYVVRRFWWNDSIATLAIRKTSSFAFHVQLYRFRVSSSGACGNININNTAMCAFFFLGIVSFTSMLHHASTFRLLPIIILTLLFNFV